MKLSLTMLLNHLKYWNLKFMIFLLMWFLLLNSLSSSSLEMIMVKLYILLSGTPPQIRHQSLELVNSNLKRDQLHRKKDHRLFFSTSKFPIWRWKGQILNWIVSTTLTQTAELHLTWMTLVQFQEKIKLCLVAITIKTRIVFFWIHLA